MELSSAWLESVLKCHQNEKRIEKVIDVKKESVVSKGDNYCSDLTRLEMKVIFGSGKVGNRSVIMKQLPASEFAAKNFKEWGVFKNEIKVYGEILPLMEDLMEELEVKEEPLWGHSIFSRPYDLIIMEDLKEKGYVMADRKKGLDLPHTQKVMSSLGKYHAMSTTLRDRGLLNIDQFGENFFIKKDPQAIAMIQGFHDQSLESFATAIENMWDSEWLPFKEKVLRYKGKTLEALIKMMEETNPKFLALNHGDCWTNNIMFCYDADTKSIIGQKFIDFQVPFYASIGYDLSYFMSTSPTQDVFENHLDEILSSYVESYQRTLQQLKHEAPTVTVDEVKAELGRYCILALIITGTSLPMMMGESEDTPEIEELFKDLEQTNSFKVNMKPYGGKCYMTKAQCILRWCMKNKMFSK